METNWNSSRTSENALLGPLMHSDPQWGCSHDMKPRQFAQNCSVKCRITGDVGASVRSSNKNQLCTALPNAAVAIPTYQGGYQGVINGDMHIHMGTYRAI